MILYRVCVKYLETFYPYFLSMSANRANAAAVQRRVNPPANNGSVRGPPQQQQQQQQMRPGQRPPQQQQQQQMPQPPPTKMSVSDAIGLLSLRLGRVETFVQQLPPLDQIGNGGGGDHGEESFAGGEGMRIVDEAVFKSICARLDRIESEEPVAAPSQETNEEVASLKAEVAQLKEMLLSLQSFTMQTNHKLSQLIFESTHAQTASDVVKTEMEPPSEVVESDEVPLEATE